VLGLRIGETLALRVSDVDFSARSSGSAGVDAATLTFRPCKSQASSADLPLPSQLETRLRAHLRAMKARVTCCRQSKCACLLSDKLRKKQLHPLLEKLASPRRFHSMRTVQPVPSCSGATRLCAEAVGTVTHGLRWEFTDTWWAISKRDAVPESRCTHCISRA